MTTSNWMEWTSIYLPFICLHHNWWFSQIDWNNIKDSHNTGNFAPYFFRMVGGYFNVPHWNFKHGRYCETGPTVYSTYPRRLESLTTCRWNCKSSTFSLVILRPWVMVRPESNSRPPAWQPDAQPTGPPCSHTICNCWLSIAWQVVIEIQGNKRRYQWTGIPRRDVTWKRSGRYYSYQRFRIKKEANESFCTVMT